MSGPWADKFSSDYLHAAIRAFVSKADKHWPTTWLRSCASAAASLNRAASSFPSRSSTFAAESTRVRYATLLAALRQPYPHIRSSRTGFTRTPHLVLVHAAKSAQQNVGRRTVCATISSDTLIVPGFMPSQTYRAEACYLLSNMWLHGNQVVKVHGPRPWWATLIPAECAAQEGTQITREAAVKAVFRPVPKDQDEVRIRALRLYRLMCRRGLRATEDVPIPGSSPCT